MTKNELAGATFSECRRYRYVLWRDLGAGEGTLCCICLNPSTADETANDPTVSRCMIRAGRMGFRRFEMLNLFAWRSTDPKGLLSIEDPVGVDNNFWIMSRALQAKMVVCAWGSASPLIPARAKSVVDLLLENGVSLNAFKISVGTGQPFHPLYRPYAEEPKGWNP